MDISRTDGAGRIDGPQRLNRIVPPASLDRTSPGDKVELSSKATMISRAIGLPEIRMDRVAEVKLQIQSGRFDTEQRLQGALDRFLAEERHPS